MKWLHEMTGNLVSRDNGGRLGVVQTELILAMNEKADRADCLAQMKTKQFLIFQFPLLLD